MLRLYGIQKGAFPTIREEWDAALHPDDFSRLKEIIRAALRGEKEYDTEFRIIRPDGKVKTLKGSGVVIRDSSLRSMGNSLELTVADTGVGFDPATVSAGTTYKGGIGLTSMRERVDLSGGVFTVDSIPGLGTCVRASWPCREEIPTRN